MKHLYKVSIVLIVSTLIIGIVGCNLFDDELFIDPGLDPPKVTDVTPKPKNNSPPYQQGNKPGIEVVAVKCIDGAIKPGGTALGYTNACPSVASLT